MKHCGHRALISQVCCVTSNLASLGNQAPPRLDPDAVAKAMREAKKAAGWDKDPEDQSDEEKAQVRLQMIQVNPCKRNVATDWFEID